MTFLRPTFGNARLTILGAAAVAVIAASVTFLSGNSQVLAQETVRPSPVPREQLKHALALSEAFRAVTKAVSPSVVNILSAQRVEPQQTGPGSPRQQSPFDDEMFRRFFDLPEGVQPFDDGQSGPRFRAGQGSGVIVRADGYIVTNNHVVAGADEIKVRVAGDAEYDAKVIGTDPESDLAVIKIEASGLTAATFGNSDEMEVGDWVVAIGSPFGYDHSVTAGIVSAKGRQVGIIRDARGFTGFEDFIQTDAAINPGNSGGPLANLYGEVIAINSAISTRTGGSAGVGFAIPSNMVQPVVNSLIEHGTVRRGALGVGIQPLTPEHAEYHGYTGTGGVIVSQVYPGSAAEKAGIRDGDIILSINGRPLTDTPTLMNVVGRSQPGDSVSVELFRKGKSQTVQVTLGDRAAQFSAGPGVADGSSGDPGSAAASRDLGIAVQNLTPEIAQQLNAEVRRGVVVSRVQRDGLASRAGITRGTIITRVDETQVSSAEDFDTAMKNANLERGVALQVVSEGVVRMVILRSTGGQ